MTLTQIAVIIAISIVLIKFVASFFGYANNTILNSLVTVILGVFVSFELFKLVEALIVKVG
ncbi:MAG TPA: hypothetical protein DEG17_02140 [Cyanobacteria bacterium UBA11149]|nr:hypothetical protein [Cyanobacteria bacterium UBA11367]HBE58752.1 hypothetical protein [Cyanobacteria bacterium UBA11366]HBK65728.1 hypothetical protein [Cyanobacteria bacterium UBA11166]HBR75094.1 hypothetical protein [Cyanobacteria bacterium UBA11159]HBS71286.1 hypothetical protein [Cyanobacteria bacterium UBA11153]HBW87708.1 hypothetical protein [Cyanobacteria bacterium UBA11149]HCA96958.1 hypothetical protein [Cyanobacteria bacterium UBA9226]